MTCLTVWECTCGKKYRLRSVRAGRSYRCPMCGARARLKPEAGQSNPFGDSVRRRAPGNAKSHLVALLLCLGAIFPIGLAIYDSWIRANVNVHVDNTSGRAMFASLDGGTPIEIPAGQHRIIACRGGTRHLRVTQGNAVLFDEEKVLRTRPGKRVNHYLLNPAGQGFYVETAVVYSSGEGRPAHSPRTRVAPLPPGVIWQELSSEYVLDAPDSIRVKAGQTNVTRTVLRRVSKEAYQQCTEPEASPFDDPLFSRASRFLQTLPTWQPGSSGAFTGR